VLRIDTRTETLEALTFQDTYTYRQVYVDGSLVDLKAKKELNEFLLFLLCQIKILASDHVGKYNVMC
jgi:hypothetical protein